MPKRLTIEVPSDAFSVLRKTPDAFANEMRLAAAIKWFELGRISQGKAAELAGMSRRAFLKALSEYEVSPFQMTTDELSEEMTRE